MLWCFPHQEMFKNFQNFWSCFGPFPPTSKLKRPGKFSVFLTGKGGHPRCREGESDPPRLPVHRRGDMPVYHVSQTQKQIGSLLLLPHHIFGSQGGESRERGVRGQQAPLVGVLRQLGLARMPLLKVPLWMGLSCMVLTFHKLVCARPKWSQAHACIRAVWPQP